MAKDLQRRRQVAVAAWEVRIQRRRRRASADVVAVLTLYSPAREKGEGSAAVHAGEEDVGVAL